MPRHQSLFLNKVHTTGFETELAIPRVPQGHHHGDLQKIPTAQLAPELATRQKNLRGASPS